jgi:hypothetical protein
MMLKAGRVDTSVALKKDSQGVLHRAGFLGRAFDLDENMLFAAPAARGSSAPNENATTRKRMRIPGV